MEESELRRRILRAAGTRLLPVVLAVLLAGAGVGVVAAESLHRTGRRHTLRHRHEYGVEPNEIAAANGLADPSRLKVGQKLEIPTGTTAKTGTAQAASAQTYTVANGDTLGAIAARFGVSEQALAAANGITNPNLLRVGQKLTIPAAGSSGSAAPTSSGTTYTVIIGDTLSAIAAQFGLTETAIAEANGLPIPTACARARS